MTERIETAAERSALPVGAVTLSAAGTIACRFDATRGVLFGDERPFEWDRLSLPLTVLYRPDAEPDFGATLGAPTTPEPQRAQPSVEEVRKLLHRCDCDCPEPSAPDHEVDYLRLAEDVHALYAAQPTVAEAIRGAASEVAALVSRQDADAPFSIRVTDLLEALARREEASNG